MLQYKEVCNIKSDSEECKQNYVRVTQGEISNKTDERDRPFKEEADWSYLGDLTSSLLDSGEHDTLPSEVTFKCNCFLLPLSCIKVVVESTIRSGQSSNGIICPPKKLAKLSRTRKLYMRSLDSYVDRLKSEMHELDVNNATSGSTESSDHSTISPITTLIIIIKL